VRGGGCVANGEGASRAGSRFARQHARGPPASACARRRTPPPCLPPTCGTHVRVPHMRRVLHLRELQSEQCLVDLEHALEDAIQREVLLDRVVVDVVLELQTRERARTMGAPALRRAPGCAGSHSAHAPPPSTRPHLLPRPPLSHAPSSPSPGIHPKWQLLLLLCSLHSRCLSSVWDKLGQQIRSVLPATCSPKNNSK